MIWDALSLSISVSSAAIVIIGILGGGLGLVLAKRNFFGREFLDSLVTLPMVLPPVVAGYYLIILVGRRGIIGKYLYELTGLSLTFTWQAAVLASTVIALPIMVKSAKAAFEGVDRDLELVSYTLGKTKLETFLKVTLPLAKNGLISGLVLSFARAIGEFGATLMLAGNIRGKTQTIPLAIYEAFTTGQDTLAQILVLILTSLSVAIIYVTNKIGQLRSF